MKARRIKYGIRKTAAQTLFARSQAFAFHYQPADGPGTVQMRAAACDLILLTMPTAQIRFLRMCTHRDDRITQNQVIGTGLDLTDLFRCKARMDTKIKPRPIGADMAAQRGLHGIWPDDTNGHVKDMRRGWLSIKRALRLVSIRTVTLPPICKSLKSGTSS